MCLFLDKKFEISTHTPKKKKKKKKKGGKDKQGAKDSSFFFLAKGAKDSRDMKES